MTSQIMLVPVEEYLHSAYEPDVDYVDGVLEERNAGEKSHGDAQREILFCLRLNRDKWNVTATRFPVPDISVFRLPEPDEEIFTQPPFLCIEILSPADRTSRMLDKIDEYLAFGVEYVWLVDPRTRRGWIHQADQSHEARDGVLRTANPDIEVPLADVFR